MGKGEEGRKGRGRGREEKRKGVEKDGVHPTSEVQLPDPLEVGWLGFNGIFSTNRPYRASFYCDFIR